MSYVTMRLITLRFSENNGDPRGGSGKQRKILIAIWALFFFREQRAIEMADNEAQIRQANMEHLVSK